VPAGLPDGDPSPARWTSSTPPAIPAAAEDLHHQALSVRVEHGLRTFYVGSLDALGCLAAQAEGFQPAARLLAASETARGHRLPRPPAPAPAQLEREVASWSG
jgi:hypothetical protein